MGYTWVYNRPAFECHKYRGQSLIIWGKMRPRAWNPMNSMTFFTSFRIFSALIQQFIINILFHNFGNCMLGLNIRSPTLKKIFSKSFVFLLWWCGFFLLVWSEKHRWWQQYIRLCSVHVREPATWNSILLPDNKIIWQSNFLFGLSQCCVIG